VPRHIIIERVSSGGDLVGVGVAVAAVIVLLPLTFFWLKGRPFAAGDVFRASRWSRGNRLYPTQVAITPQAVVHYTPEIIGRREQSIHMAHVSSVSINTNLLFSDVIIETSGGSAPIRCHGHRKQDAVRMKQLIEQYQTAYYRSAGSELKQGNPPISDVR
jgi:hypothetical protein